MKLPTINGFFRLGYLMQDDEELIKLLEDLGDLRSEYPPELLAPRRASLIAQVEQWEKARASHEPHSSKRLFSSS